MKPEVMDRCSILVLKNMKRGKHTNVTVLWQGSLRQALQSGGDRELLLQLPIPKADSLSPADAIWASASCALHRPGPTPSAQGV